MASINSSAGDNSRARAQPCLPGRRSRIPLELQVLEDRCTPAAVTSPTQAFISQAYLDLLNRPVDAGGLAAWTAVINQGGSHQQVITGIESSLEYREAEAGQLYTQLLHRPADAGGLTVWGQFLANGGSYQQAAALIAGSNEFFATQGGSTVSGFLNALFEDALGRQPDAAGLASLGQAISNGMSRSQAALLVFGSLEYDTDLVASSYERLLRRAADAPSLSFLAASVQNGFTYDQLIATLAGSAEYAGVTTSTSTALAASVTSPIVSQSVTFTATVQALEPGLGTPTGVVTFKNNGAFLAYGTLSSAGQATYTTTTLLPGSNSITATYNGNSAFSASIGTSALTVAKASTTTTLSSTPSSPVIGQSITLTAMVNVNSPGSGFGFGNVTFKDTTTGTTLGTATVDALSGIATLSVSTLGLGAHSITASYAGDVGGNFNASTSSALALTVGPANTQTTVQTSLTPSVFGQNVTFTATVAAVSPGTGTPTGNVTFVDTTTGTTLGSGVLSSGTTTLTVSSVPVGTNTITATYGGDTGGTFTTSSGTTTQVVNQALSSTSLISSENPSNLADPVTFTVQVAAVSPGAGTPTGSVNFVNTTTNTPLGTGTLNSNGTASVTVPSGGFVTGGSATYVISATYAGDTNFQTSISNNISQIVN